MRKYLSHEAVIFFGGLLGVGSLLKVLGYVKIDPDWFWFLAGVGLVFEGVINLAKQKRFDKKYKIVLKEEIKKRK